MVKLPHIARRGCGVSILRHIQKLPGCGPGQLVFGGPTRAGGWSRWHPEVCASLSSSVMLWFSNSRLLKRCWSWCKARAVCLPQWDALFAPPESEPLSSGEEKNTNKHLPPLPGDSVWYFMVLHLGGAQGRETEAGTAQGKAVKDDPGMNCQDF